MIKKIKDLKKVKLSPDDVMIEAVVEVKVKSSLDLSAVSSSDMEDINKDREKLISLTLINKGDNVIFNIGDIVSLRPKIQLSYDLVDEVKGSNKSLEKRIIITGKNAIHYSTSPDNIN